MINPIFNMRDRRKELKLTLEDVGKYVGVSKGTVSKWENGNIKNMRSDKISLLAEILQVNVMDILSICKNAPNLSDVNAESDDEDEDENFVHPEDLYAHRRSVFRDTYFDDEPKRTIMYQDIDTDPLYETFSKEDFDFIVQTIEMLKSKADSK